MRRSKVSPNVGIACFGSFLVLAFEIPSAPYQFCSLIKPGHATPLGKLLLRNLLLYSYNKNVYLPVISVIRVKPKSGIKTDKVKNLNLYTPK